MLGPPRAFFSKDPSRRMPHQEKSTSATTLYARATLYDPKSIRAASSPLTRLLPAARPRGVRRPGMRGSGADPQKWVNRPLSPGTVPRRPAQSGWARAAAVVCSVAHELLQRAAVHERTTLGSGCINTETDPILIPIDATGLSETHPTCKIRAA